MQKIFLKSCMCIYILLLSYNACGTKLVSQADLMQSLKTKKTITQLNDAMMQEKALKQINILNTQKIFMEAAKNENDTKIAFIELNEFEPKAQECVLDEIVGILIDCLDNNSLLCCKNIFIGIAQLDSKMQKYVLKEIERNKFFYEVAGYIINGKCQKYITIFEDIIKLEPEIQKYILIKPRITVLLNDYRTNKKFISDLFDEIDKLSLEAQEYILKYINIQAFFMFLVKHDSYNLKKMFIGINQLRPAMQKHFLDQIDIEKTLIGAIFENNEKLFENIFIGVFQLEPIIQEYALSQINIDNVLIIAELFKELDTYAPIMLSEIGNHASTTQRKKISNRLYTFFGCYHYANKIPALDSFIHQMYLNNNSNRIEAIFTEITKIRSLEQRYAVLNQIKIGNILMAAAYYGDYHTFIQIIKGISLIANKELKEYIFEQIDIYAALDLISRKHGYDIDSNKVYFNKIIALANDAYPDSIPSSEIMLFSKVITPSCVKKNICWFYKIITDAPYLMKVFKELKNDPQNLDSCMSCLLPNLVNALAVATDYYDSSREIVTCQIMNTLTAIINQIILCPNKNDVKYELLPIIFETLLKIIHNNKYNGYIKKDNIITLMAALSKHKNDSGVLNFIEKLYVEISDIKELRQNPALMTYIENILKIPGARLNASAKRGRLVNKQQQLHEMHFLAQKISLGMLNSQGGQ